jgi:hypothetical protein
MVAFDQPVILEPDADEGDKGAETQSPETSDAAPDGGDDYSAADLRRSRSGSVPIAVGLAALLPLPANIQRRC